MGRNTLQVQIYGEREPRVFDRSFTIGRAAENDVVVEDSLVSTRHVTVTLDADGWRIRDLETTNGTFLDGNRVALIPLRGPTEIRLAHANGPRLLFTPAEVAPGPGKTVVGRAADSDKADRYLSDEPPEDMSSHTAMVRTLITEQRRRAATKPRIAVAVLAIIAVTIGALAYRQRGQIASQRAAASDMFYMIRALELEIANLPLDEGARTSLRERQGELERQYREIVEDLGIYDEDTPAEVRLIYDVVRRFGESEIDVPPGFIDEVIRFIEKWQRSPPTAAFRRAEENGYGRRIAAIMLEHGLPPEFFYLAMQESALDPDAIGPETRFGFAKGMWQFIPGTAREYGLRLGPLVSLPTPDSLDQRHDVEASTRAAARYLRYLYTTDAQASGLLVMASYNWGQTNVLRLIRQLPATPRDRNFWKLLGEHRESIPQETYDYVFRIIAATVVGEQPDLFGFDFPPPLPARGPGS